MSFPNTLTRSGKLSRPRHAGCECQMRTRTDGAASFRVCLADPKLRVAPPPPRHTQLSFGIRRAPSLTIEATLLMLEFFERLFSTDFMPHGYCLRLPGLIALHAASDGVIALSYFRIPISLMRLVRGRNPLFPGMFLLFSTFIFTCGTTHALSVWTLWTSFY